MRRGIAGVVLATSALMAGPPAVAHHSFAAQYDSTKPVTITGSVARVEWMNPHVYFYLDVADGGGKATWSIEGGAPNTLYRAGWRKDAIKVGDVMTVYGFLARDGTKLVNMRTATLADGRNVLGGQNDGGPAAKRPPGH